MAQGTQYDCQTGEAIMVDLPPTTPEQLRAMLRPITRRQAKRALSDAGLLEATEAAIGALPEPQRTAALIDWQEAADFERGHPLIAAIGEDPWGNEG